MSQKFAAIAIAAATLITFQIPAKADGVLGAGKEIAKCAVSNPSDPDFGSVLEVFQRNDENASLVVVFGKDGDKNLLPADNYRFSTDKGSLEVQFANFINAEIPRGTNTDGTLRVKLGSGPSALNCVTSW